MSNYSYLLLCLCLILFSSCNSYQNLVGTWIVQPKDNFSSYKEIRLYKDRSAFLLFTDSSSAVQFWQYDQKEKQIVFSDLNSSYYQTLQTTSIGPSRIKIKHDTSTYITLNRSLYIPKLDRTVMYTKLIGVWGGQQRKRKNAFYYSLFPLGQLVAHHPTQEFIGTWSLSPDAKELTFDSKVEQQTYQIVSVEHKTLTLYNDKIKSNSQLYRLKHNPKIKHMPLQDAYFLGHWSVKKVGENMIKDDIQTIIFKGDYTYKKFQENKIIDLGNWSFDPTNQEINLSNDDEFFMYEVLKKKKKSMTIRDEHQSIVFQRKNR